MTPLYDLWGLWQLKRVQTKLNHNLLWVYSKDNQQRTIFQVAFHGDGRTPDFIQSFMGRRIFLTCCATPMEQIASTGQYSPFQSSIWVNELLVYFTCILICISLLHVLYSGILLTIEAYVSFWLLYNVYVNVCISAMSTFVDLCTFISFHYYYYHYCCYCYYYV